MENSKNILHSSEAPFKLLDKLSAMSAMGVRVIDRQTLETYYTNTAALGIPEKDSDAAEAIAVAEQGHSQFEWYTPQANKTFLKRLELTEWDGRPVMIEYITDVSSAKRQQDDIFKSYRSEIGAAEDTEAVVICSSQLNLTKNRVLGVQVGGCSIPLEGVAASPDHKVRLGCVLKESYITEEQQHKVCNEQLIARYRQGIPDTRITYPARAEDGSLVYVCTEIVVEQEPETGDLVAHYYTSNMFEYFFRERTLKALSNIDYDFLCGIDAENDTYKLYFYNPNTSLPELSGSNYTDAVRQYCAQCVVPEQREKTANELSLGTVVKALEKAPLHTVRCDLTDKDGTVHKKVLRLVYLDRRAGLILMTRSDVTESVSLLQQQNSRLESALHEADVANRAKTSFLSNMSHDIRTPLNGIIGMTEIALRDNRDERVQRSLDMIASSSRFLLSLINDILDISKIENGSMELNERPVPLSEFDDVVASVVKPLMDRKNIEFIYQMNCGLTCAMLDGVRFNQIFFNLLSNAAKYTPVGGRVEFLAHRLEKTETGEWVRFTVRDNGMGFAPEFVPRAFEPFEQDDKANAGLQNQGTGLGLAITKELVELMGGRIALNSTQGKGSEFTVDLPLKAAVMPQLQQAAALQNVDSILCGKRVLLVEDNRINAIVAGNLLEDKGVQVIYAVNGSEAVELFARAAPGSLDAVLMDIRMPVMDGLAATRKIRAMDKTDARTIPIIAMTANAFVEDEDECLACGMNAHLAKPIESQRLFETLAEKLSETQIHAEQK